MARKSTNAPWLHGASGWWCTSVNGKRKKLDRDFPVACRKLKALRARQKRGDIVEREWLDAAFSELADHFLTDVQTRKKPATYDACHYRLLRALRVLGTTLRVGELRKFHLTKLEQEMTKGEYSPTTIKDTIATVQQVLNWAVDQEMIGTSPVPKYRKPEARQRSRTITGEEFRALLRHTDRPFRRFLIALLRTGCRPGELRTLIWEWVDLEQGLWIIPEHKTITRMKKPRPRIIPLPRTVWMMCRWLARKPHTSEDHVFINVRGKPYKKDCLVEKMSRLRDRAGIPIKGGERLVLYSHRHTFGTESVGKVGDIELAELMGHTDPEMTKRYVHLNVERLKNIQRRAQGRG